LTADPRRALLAIQKRLWRNLRQEIEATIEGDPPNIAIYREEFERDLRSYESVSNKSELVRAALAAGVVYLGDYHTLPQAQKTLVKLLLALTRTSRPVILGFEMVRIEHQEHLDRYLADPSSANEERFLHAIDYWTTWAFDWAPYREVLQLCHRRGVRVVGINSDPRDHPHDHLLERDFRSAAVLLEEIRAQPEALLVVFDGDLHVARDHLPLLIDNEVQKAGLPARRRVIVHQNAEEIWWQLARDRLEDTNVVRLAPDAFCVFNASPIEKLHSYLNWVSERETLEPPLATSTWAMVEDEDEDEEDEAEDLAQQRVAEYQEQVHQIACTVATFLEIERDDLDDFHLFTVNDLDFLDWMAEDGAFTERELEDVKRQILSNESYFIPKGDVIYLSDFSVVNAAEEATHFLHHRCSGYRWDKPRDLATDFYFRIVTEALGFFGSKVLVPTRECWREKDCEVFLENYRVRQQERKRRRAAGEEGDGGDTSVLEAMSEERVKVLTNQKLTRRASTLVLEHRDLERRYLEQGGPWPGAGRCLTQPTEVHLLLTHMLGHMLGDKLYFALLLNKVSKSFIRQLFHDPLEQPGLALGRYLELVKSTQGVGHGPSRGERL